MKVPQLEKTTNYKIFKKIDSNRDIVKGHLKKLKACIETKNLLYLFPIVVNKQMDVVDGQHRLKAAEELGLPIFYLVDDNITKADIAMVNSNRKSWGMKDYIEFYAREGNKEFKRLKFLIEEYRIKCGTAARLLDGQTVRYTQGGAQFSRNIKSGKLNDDHYVIAVAVCDLCRRLLKDRDYALDPFFMLDVKNAIIQSGVLAQTATDKIYSKRNVLPVVTEEGTTFLRLLKDILGITQLRPYSSQRDVDAYLDMHSTRVKA